MYNKFVNPDLKQHYHIKVDDELKADARMWITFLSQDRSLCCPFMDFSDELAADKMQFYTDAAKSAKLGFGYFFNGSWTSGIWGEFIDRADPSIEFLELYGMALAIVLWANRLKNRRVIIFCDNESVVEMVNQSSARCPNSMILIR